MRRVPNSHEYVTLNPEPSQPLFSSPTHSFANAKLKKGKYVLFGLRVSHVFAVD